MSASRRAWASWRARACASIACLAVACATPQPSATPTAPAPSPPAWFALVPDRPAAMPVVVASINGASLRTVLDTGATTSAVSIEAVEELALTPVGTELVRDASGATLELPTFSLDVVLGPQRSTVRASPMRRTAGIDVVLGRDFLDDVELYLPRGADRLALYEPGAAPRAHLTQVPLERDADGLFVRIEARTPARRAISVRMLVDTGASVSRITLSDAGSDELNPDGARRGRGVLGGLTTFGTLALADAALGSGPKAPRIGALLVNVDDAQHAPALLGMDALARFDVLIATGAGTLHVGEAW